MGVAPERPGHTPGRPIRRDCSSGQGAAGGACWSRAGGGRSWLLPTCASLCPATAHVASPGPARPCALPHRPLPPPRRLFCLTTGLSPAPRPRSLEQAFSDLVSLASWLHPQRPQLVPLTLLCFFFCPLFLPSSQSGSFMSSTGRDLVCSWTWPKHHR